MESLLAAVTNIFYKALSNRMASDEAAGNYLAE